MLNPALLYTVFAGAKVAGRTSHETSTEDSAAWWCFLGRLCHTLNYNQAASAMNLSQMFGLHTACDCRQMTSFSTPGKPRSEVHFLVRSSLTGIEEEKAERPSPLYSHFQFFASLSLGVSLLVYLTQPVSQSF